MIIKSKEDERIILLPFHATSLLLLRNSQQILVNFNSSILFDSVVFTEACLVRN